MGLRVSQKFHVRVELIEERGPATKNSEVAEVCVESFMVDVPNVIQGEDLMEDVAGYLEENHGKEIFEEDDEKQ